MPTPAHALMTWKGTFGPPLTPIEEWQFSLKADGAGLLVSDEYDVLAQAMVSVYTTWFPPYFPNNVVLTECEYARVGANGLYEKDAEGAYRRGLATANVAGSVSGHTQLPLQTAVCVSLVTGRAGPSGKGRFYLPFPATTLDSGGRIPEAYLSDFAMVCGRFVGDVGLIDGPVSVMSSKGFASDVLSVKVGRVPDTQRRRRGDLIEAYVAKPLTA